MGTPTAYAPPPLVPGALPSTLPYDPSVPSALATPETGSPAAAKLAQDAEMRRLFGPLWSEAVAQSRARKAGGSTAPEAQAPRMVQRAADTTQHPERFEHDLPLAANPHVHANTKRAANCNRTEYLWPHPECKARYVDEYKSIIEQSFIMSCDLIGGGDPRCTCLSDVPVFVTCVDEQIGNTLFDNPAYFDWPKKILDYRNITRLWDENSIQGSCTFSTHIDCPEPATTREGMFRQIDESLNQTKAMRIYLNQTQLDDYLAWRKSKGETDGFRYVRVSNRKPIERSEEPESKQSAWDAYGKFLGFGLAGLVGICSAAGMVRMYLLERARIRNIVNTTTVPAPAHSAPTVHKASPSSMGSASVTMRDQGVKASNALSQGQASSESSVVSSEDGLESTSIEIPPAGQEGDA